MNCKPGDLAIVVPIGGFSYHAGKVVSVVMLDDFWPNHWQTDPILFDADNGYWLVWDDRELHPIRDQPGEDEMLRIAGKPHEVSA